MTAKTTAAIATMTVEGIRCELFESYRVQYDGTVVGYMDLMTVRTHEHVFTTETFITDPNDTIMENIASIQFTPDAVELLGNFFNFKGIVYCNDLYKARNEAISMIATSGLNKYDYGYQLAPVA